MATRASRRRKISIPDETNLLPELGSPAAMATRKRHTRRQKENERNVVGQFVKYPQGSPIKNEVEPKSTRKTRGALTDNNTFTSGQGIDKNEEQPVKLARNTRSNRKNASVNITNWENVGKNKPETAGSPKTKTKSRNNKRKALQRSDAIDSVLESFLDVEVLSESINTCENSRDSDNKRKSRRNGKSRKQAFDTELYEFSKETKESTADHVKTAGSFKVSLVKHQEVSLTSTNTSTDSFHSAAGSPAHGGLALEHRKTSQQSDDRILDNTYEKKTKEDMNSTITITADTSVVMNGTYEKKSTPNKSPKRPSDFNDRLSIQKSSTPNLNTEEGTQKTVALANELITKFNTTYDKLPERKSFRISIQNEKGKMSEDIFDTTVVLIDSSVDTTSPIHASTKRRSSKGMQSVSPAKQIVPHIETVPNKQQTPEVCLTSHSNQNANKCAIITPKLIREGTFTKESPQVLCESVSPCKGLPSANGSTENILTPVKTKSSLPAPGSTPYHSQRKNTRSIEKCQSVLNVTRSIEKEKNELRRSSSMATVRPPKVMFCSPVWNEIRDKDRKSRIIKSSLKGSNKSFVLEELVAPLSSSRKRSYTQSDAEDINAKRKKLTGDDLVNSVNRLSRSKATTPSHAKLNQSASKEPVTPTRAKTLTPLRSKSETKSSSTSSKLPDFAALHKKAFDRMESLSECQERKAQRARQMLHFPPTGVYTLDGRKSPKVTSVPVLKIMPEKPTETKPGPVIKSRVPLMKAASEMAEKSNKSYTRFGFKLPTDINPFSIPSTKTTTTKNIMKATQKINTTISQVPKPNSTIVQAKLNGTVPSLRREKSKQMVTREKSTTVITEKRKRENRDILKGVRTNRRFELQMKSRSMNT